jgi:hypothetical protein
MSLLGTEAGIPVRRKPFSFRYLEVALSDKDEHVT